MRTIPNERCLMAKFVRNGISIKFVAKMFGIHRNTASYWTKQDLRTVKDLPRKPKEGKVTVEVEIAILTLRLICKWGTGRIQQGLMKLPDYMITDIKIQIQGIKLSRTTINNVLKKHGINGYRKKCKSWKFFRAKKPNELWQLDLKGPFRVEGKRYWILVCIDDYSRCILLLKLFDHKPNLSEIEESLKEFINKHKPKKILTDNNPFGKSWKKWCRMQGTKAIFAHPYYPQDKGKVERTIRNLVEEFINLLKHFPQWLKGKLEEWRKWYNKERYHRGIKNYPAKLYAQLET